jgi:hypothetical protein
MMVSALPAFTKPTRSSPMPTMTGNKMPMNPTADFVFDFGDSSVDGNPAGFFGATNSARFR